MPVTESRWRDMFWCLVVASSVCPGHAHYNLKAQTKFKSDYSLGVGANFGFSVTAISKGSQSKLIVGAPLADQIGNVFACDLHRNICSGVNKAGIEIYMVKERFNENELNNQYADVLEHCLDCFLLFAKRDTLDEKYNNESYWYGATVSGNDNFFVACAPRFIDKDKRHKKHKGGNSGTFGRCYQYRDPTLKPELLKSSTDYYTNEKHFEATMDSLGWCSAIESDQSILIGGPAMVSGRVLKTKTNLVATTVGQPSTNFNFGYSVASGKFIMKNSELIAVGSPYGYDGHGKVSFRLSKTIGISVGELLGPRVGSMYGAVLCAARIAYRAKDDLLVGAPTSAEHGAIYNVGAVYIYTASPRNAIPALRNTIVGKGTNSYFGAAIVNVGDLNGDKFDDIVIAAPYEDGTGVVYLYSGGHLVRNTNNSPLQVIRPESSIRSFGYSLAIVRDFDENGCNELAIGAPQSNEVVLLRCVAAITVKLSKFRNTVQISNNGAGEIKNLSLCLNAEFPDKPTTIDARIQIQILIEHDGVTLPTTGIEIINIQDKTGPFCKTIEMFMKGTGDYNKKIFYTLKASLLDDPTDRNEFKPSDVKLNEQSVLFLDGSIWAQECGDTLCQPKLEMSVNYTHLSHESKYVIGSSPSINVLISVKNSGDVAYDACVRVAVTGAEVGYAPTNCRMDDLNKVLECRPSRHLRKGAPWDQQGIDIDTTALTSSNSEIMVNLTLYNECGLNITKNIMKKISTIASTKHIYVQGRTDTGADNTVNMTKNDIATEKQFHHIYTISNRGQTNWVNVPISVAVQNLDVVTSTAYLKNKQCLAGDVSASADFVTYVCEAEFLSKHTAVEVNVILTVVPDKLDGVIGKENITVQSNIEVKLHSHVESAEVTSVLKLIEAAVPIWIIIVASVMGLLILLIIFLILRQCGFLERKNKKQLKQVRQSVRRQTMMRQTLMNRLSVQREDQEQLVNEATASFEDAKKKKDRRVVIQN